MPHKKNHAELVMGEATVVEMVARIVGAVILVGTVEMAELVMAVMVVAPLIRR